MPARCAVLSARHVIKTGATKQSKMVLVGSGKPGLVPLIVVTMREPSRDQEEKDAVRLLKWGSALYASPSPSPVASSSSPL